MRKIFNIFSKALACVLSGILLCGCGASGSVLCQSMDTAMGTVVAQTIFCPDEESGEEASDAIIELLNQLERQELSWRLETSEVFAVNGAAGSGDGFLLSKEMTLVINECLRLSEESEGAFDVTLGSVTRLWNIDSWAAGGVTEGFVPPDRELLIKTLGDSGSSKLRLEPEVRGDNGETVQARIFLTEGMQLDLGAVGKGIALDLILDSLGSSEVNGAVVSVGGSVLTYGRKPNGAAWKVGIRDPLNPSENIGMLLLEGQWCVSTSGDYERYVEVDGVRYHHILDPATGMPADSGVRSVTILSKEGLLSDALSTACFVLGVEKGMALADRCGAEALFVTAEGETVMTEGMEEYYWSE